MMMRCFSFLSLITVLTVFFAAPSFAQCTSPDGDPSETRYTSNKLYYCSGTTWREVPGTASGGTGAGCIVGTAYVPGGENHTFYNTPNHTNCSSVTQSRTCTNGVLGGNPSYSHPSCSNVTPITATYIGQGTSSSTSTSISFGSFTVPAGGGLMVVIATVISDGAGTINTVSIGGSAGTMHFSTPSGNWRRAIASRVVAAGSRAVSLSLSGSQGTANTHSVEVWVLTNYDSATPADTDSNVGDNLTNIALSLDIPAGGVALYSGVHANTNNTIWSNATENVDTTVSCCTTVNRKHSNAQYFSSSSQTGFTQTTSWGGSDTASITGASWK